jgi:hypothetical protein
MNPAVGETNTKVSEEPAASIIKVDCPEYGGLSFVLQECNSLSPMS